MLAYRTTAITDVRNFLPGTALLNKKVVPVALACIILRYSTNCTTCNRRRPTYLDLLVLAVARNGTTLAVFVCLSVLRLDLLDLFVNIFNLLQSLQ